MQKRSFQFIVSWSYSPTPTPGRVSIILKVFSLKNVGILWALSTSNSGWLAANHMLHVDERKCHRTRRGNLRRKNRRGAAPGGVKGRLETQRAQHFLGGRSFMNFFFLPQKIYFPHLIIFWQEQGELRACSSVFSILLCDLHFPRTSRLGENIRLLFPQKQNVQQNPKCTGRFATANPETDDAWQCMSIYVQTANIYASTCITSSSSLFLWV